MGLPYILNFTCMTHKFQKLLGISFIEDNEKAGKNNLNKSVCKV